MRVKAVRRHWLFFGILLTGGIFAFTVSADWSAQSPLDLAVYVVSVIGTLGVLIYAFGGRPISSVFWSGFRWVFLALIILQVFVHAIRVANGHGYSLAGTVAFVLVVALAVGWIYALQWLAMTRLAKEQ